jgi:hypothetical protein
MRPARQGDFDGFCGLYAIVNALELVGVTGPKRSLHRSLFHELVVALGGPRVLGAFRRGLDPDDLIRASRPAFRWLSLEHGVRLHLERPFNETEFFGLDDFCSALRTKTAGSNAAAIVQFQLHGTAHWSVMKAVKADRMVLRDSMGRSHLDLTNLQIGRGARFLRTSETLLLKRLPSEEHQ